MLLFLARLFSKFQQLFKPEFAAGADAERAFEALCREQKYMWERISQDQRSYREQYAAQTDHGKRGDYLIRGFNVEVEVKCKNIYGRESYQFLNWQDIERHLRMQKKSNNPVVFAFFERDGRRAVKNSLRMIALQDLVEPRKPRIIYSKSKKALMIPRSAMVHGLCLLKNQLPSRAS